MVVELGQVCLASLADAAALPCTTRTRAVTPPSDAAQSQSPSDANVKRRTASRSSPKEAPMKPGQPCYTTTGSAPSPTTRR